MILGKSPPPHHQISESLNHLVTFKHVTLKKPASLDEKWRCENSSKFIWGVINKIPAWLRYIKVPPCNRDYMPVVSCFLCNNHIFMGCHCNPLQPWIVEALLTFSHSPFFFTATLQWMVTRLEWSQNECTKIVPKNHLNSTPWCCTNLVEHLVQLLCFRLTAKQKVKAHCEIS